MVLDILQIVLGSVFVLFIPGLIWSFAFFPKKDEIDWIERIALSFGLSIALVPLVVFYANFLGGLEINLLSVSVMIILICVAGIAVWWYRTKGKTHKDKPASKPYKAMK